jgi:hypothetical protein
MLADASALVLDNCLFFSNSGSGAVLACDSFPSLQLVNCTVAGNPADGLLLNALSAVQLQNSIFFNPGFVEFNLLSNEASVLSAGGNLLRDNSLAGLVTGADQTNADPFFTGNGNFPFQLSDGSPAINKGTMPDDAPEFDLAGSSRLQNNCIDIGAFESSFDAACLSDSKEATEADLSFSIFPNPAGDFLSLELNGEAKGPFELSIVNLLGQEVRAVTLEKSDGTERIQLDLSELGSGIFNCCFRKANRCRQRFS